MSASYTRVNWADYPATTTPVNAENLNKMDAGIAGLTSEINSVESDVSALNSSLTASDTDSTKFQFSYDSTSDQFGYIRKVAGADTFVPFSNNPVCFITSNVSGWYIKYMTYNGGDYFDSGYTQDYTALATFLVNNCDFLSAVSFIAGAEGKSATLTLSKTGYYLGVGGSNIVTYKTAGSTVSYSAPNVLMYLGETDPTQ